MKKLLLTLVAGFLASMSFAQVSGTININVTDSGAVAPGVAIFFFDDPSQLIQPAPPSYILTPENYVNWAYTDANGDVSFNFTNMNPNDTLLWGTFDCFGSFSWGATTANFSQNTQNLWLNCLPGACDALTRISPQPSGNALLAEAVILRDSNYLSSIPGTVSLQWTFNGITTSNGTTVVYNPNQAGPFSYCFQTYSNCTAICDSATATGGGTPLNCQASYFVDTVNSRQFQSQIILGENSTTSAGSIIDWSWDFGDGTVLNGQYPSHTYASATGVYNICLTITSVDGVDTCTSIFCDSIGFDANGDLVFKNGFTVNVIDPATFALGELNPAAFKLFPNPAKELTTLSWEQTAINRVEIYNLNGQKVMSLNASGKSKLEISGLPQGAYIVRLRSESAATALRLLVE